MAGTLVLLGGLSASKEHPVRGGAQVAVSGLALGFMWAFMPPIAIVVLGITGYGVFRAYRFWREERRERDARPSRGTPA
jgi:hypothetical protein